jgi:small GTP-binding protein
MMEISAKVCILGQSNVGKTSLLQRYLSNQFHQQHAATIGAAFARKEIYVDEDTSVLLEMWDTAGQERFRSMAPQVCVCVYVCVCV